MESISAGDLVTVSSDGPKVDGIVFDAPSTTETGGAGHRRSGHTRAAMHRTTGKCVLTRGS